MNSGRPKTIQWAVAAVKTAHQWWCAPPSRLLVGLALIDEIVDHARIREGGGVTKAAELVLGNLAQDAAHDLPRAGLQRQRAHMPATFQGPCRASPTSFAPYGVGSQPDWDRDLRLSFTDRT